MLRLGESHCPVCTSSQVPLPFTMWCLDTGDTHFEGMRNRRKGSIYQRRRGYLNPDAVNPGTCCVLSTLLCGLLRHRKWIVLCTCTITALVRGQSPLANALHKSHTAWLQALHMHDELVFCSWYTLTSSSASHQCGGITRLEI